MFARLTLLEIDTVRTSMSEALRRFRIDVAPRLQEQPGYRGVFVMSTPEGKGALMSLWETEAQAAGDDNTFYAEAISRFVTLFRAPPGRECYEVVYIDEPAQVG